MEHFPPPARSAARGGIPAAASTVFAHTTLFLFLRLLVGGLRRLSRRRTSLASSLGSVSFASCGCLRSSSCGGPCALPRPLRHGLLGSSSSGPLGLRGGLGRSLGFGIFLRGTTLRCGSACLFPLLPLREWRL